MEEYSLEDYKNVIILKNQLLTMDIYQLKALYQDYETYLLFLDTISVLISIDCGFLFLRDDIISKIEQIIQYNRFEADSDTFQIINEMIQYFNTIQNYSPNRKKILTSSYLAYQEDIRKMKLKDMNDLFQAIAFDANVIVALEQNTMDFLSDNRYFLSSFNYMIESIPELFENSSCDLLQEKLHSIEVRPWPFDRDSRQSLKKAEEHFKKKKKRKIIFLLFSYFLIGGLLWKRK